MPIPPASTVFYTAQSANIGSATVPQEGRAVTLDANKNVYYVASFNYFTGTNRVFNDKQYQTFNGTNNIPYNELGVGKLDASGRFVWGTLDSNYMPSMDGAVMSGGDIAVDASGNVFMGYSATGNSSNPIGSGGANKALNASESVVMTKINGVNGNVLDTNVFQKLNAPGTSVRNYRPYFQTAPGAGIGANKIYGAHNTSGTISGETASGSASDLVVWRINPVTFTVEYSYQKTAFNSGAFMGLKGIVVDKQNSMYAIGQTNGVINTNGRASDISGGGEQVWVQKFDASGTFLWGCQDSKIQPYDLSNNVPLTAGSILYPKIAVDDNYRTYGAYRVPAPYVIRGAGGSSSGNNDIAIFQLSANGYYNWAKQISQFNTTSNDNFPQIVGRPDGGAFLTFQTAGTINTAGSSKTGTGAFNIVIAEVDASGTLLFAQQKPAFNAAGAGATTGVFQYESRGVARHSDGTIVVGAQTNALLPSTGNTSGGQTTNSVGFVAFSTIVGIPGPAPNPPVVVIRPVCTDHSIKIWFSRPTGGQTPDSFEVGYGGGNPGTNFSTIIGVNNGTYTFTGLNNAQNYSTYVKAIYNNGYSAPTFFRNVQPGLKPNAVQDLSASFDNTNFTATLTWNAPTTNADIADIGWYVTSNVTNGTRSNTLVNDRSITFSDIAPGVFTYNVQAVNDPGYGPSNITTSFTNLFTYYGFDNGVNQNCPDSANRHNLLLSGYSASINYDADAKVGTRSLITTTTSPAAPLGFAYFTNSMAAYSQFSYTTWVKWTGPYDSTNPNNSQYLFNFGSNAPGTGSRVALKAVGASGKPEFNIVSGSSNFALTATNALSAGVWTHLGVTVDGTSAKLYVNGAVDVSGATTLRVSDLTCTSNVLSASYYGRVDEVGIFNRALSASQMSGIYTSNATTSLSSLSSFLFQNKNGAAPAKPTNYPEPTYWPPTGY